MTLIGGNVGEMDVEDLLRVTLKSERCRRRLSQASAASAVGRTRKWLSDYERGVSDPAVGTVLGLAAMLGVRVHVEVDPGPLGVLVGSEPAHGP